MIQKYYQGGYLYIPKKNYCEERKQTAYKMELDRRDRRIYLKHLEGRSNVQLGNIYHLAETSTRRIILKEKVRYQEMRKTLEQIIPLWGMESGTLRNTLALFVITSPISPFPLVTAFRSCPSS